MRILDNTRKKYHKKFKDKVGCVFCAKDEPLECHGLKGKYWRVFMNKFPYMEGNVMIVPRRHVEKTGDLTSEEWKDFGKVLVNTQKVLGKVFEVDSFNIGMNMGPESGASIPHLHWQIIPRKFRNITVMDTFADLHVISLSSEEAKKMIDKETLRK
jgi:ATP adenylyltransferase